MISILLIAIFFLNIYDNLDKKYREIVNYIIIGGLTTVVSLASYYILRIFIDSYMIATVISWILAVSFAYITNKTFVFQSKEKNVLKEFAKFIASRLTSLLIELLSMYVLVDIIKINDKISKLIVQFIVLVLNYLFSKLIVFKKEK